MQGRFQDGRAPRDILFFRKPQTTGTKGYAVPIAQGDKSVLRA